MNLHEQEFCICTLALLQIAAEGVPTYVSSKSANTAPYET